MITRPSMYSIELIEEICFDIATSSKSIVQICNENDKYPCFKTFFKWLNDPTKEEIIQLYARAKTLQADFLGTEILPIADNPNKGIKTVTKEWGNEVTEGDNVDRSKVMIDARKWLMAKLNPKKYGEKLDIEHTHVEQPLFLDKPE